LAGNSKVYLLVERWSSTAGAEKHLAQTQSQDATGKSAGASEPADVAEYEMVSIGDPKKLL
jgi:quinol monooxygenase YgiN